jgi:hypothetical protein
MRPFWQHPARRRAILNSPSSTTGRAEVIVMSGSATRYGRALGLAATAVLALSPASTGGAQAATVRPAATTCVLNGYTPTSVTLSSAAVKTTFAVQVSGCEVAHWLVAPEDLDDFAHDGHATISISPKGLKNADAGPRHAAVGALGVGEDEDTGGVSEEATFSLLRRSTWESTFNATPEPVKKNARITVKGTLTRVSWNGTKKATYGTYSDRPVDIQFQAPGTTTWTTIKSVKTGKTGKVSSTVKALTTGTWRLHFKGNSVSGAANSKTDKVVVN